MPFNRRERSDDEDLGSSTDLYQLRELQSQLGDMIEESTIDDNESITASSTLSPSSKRQDNWLLGEDCYDIEAGMAIPTLRGGGRELRRIKSLCFMPSAAAESSPVVSRSYIPSALSDAPPSPVSTMPALLSNAPPSPISSFTNESQVSSKISDERTIDTGAAVTPGAKKREGRGGLRKRRHASAVRNISQSLKRSGSAIRKSFASKGDLSSGLDLTLRGRVPNYNFLGKDKDRDEGSLLPNAKWWHAIFGFSLISLLACIITLWAPYPIGARMSTAAIAKMPWSDGCQGLQMCICPRETICADDLLSMVFLTLARSTAWFDYPLYMLLFMSKARNLNDFLQGTTLRCWINFSDYHRVHSLFGIIVGIEGISHSFFHILRWARRRDDIQLLWTSKTGITGLIAITLTPFIILPMTVPHLKGRMSFEWRKGLHYLSLVWGAALMYHAPQRIFWVIGVPFFIYIADKMVESLFKTHLIESAHFQRLGDTSCIVSFKNPPGFGKQNSAYIYLMLPWLSKYQHHAFTVFPCTKKNHSSICINKCGNWTQKLMKTITTPTHKPAFIAGPFLSPFSSPAMDSENLIAIASGIGVTPAISLIRQYSNTSRRLNLVWICRDAGLVEHFLQNVEFASNGYTLIYYTGKGRSVIVEGNMPPNVFIFNGRPNLEKTLSGIIASVATGDQLPEELREKVLTRTPAEMRSKLLLEKALSIYTMDQLYAYTVKASDHNNEVLELDEPPMATVNYQGVLSTMEHLLGDDCKLVQEKITKNFEMATISCGGRMNQCEFELFFNLMLEGSDDAQEVSSMAMVKHRLQRMNSRRNIFESSNNNTASTSESESRDEFRIKNHLQGDGKFSARNWNMLYCGGSQPVVDQLKAFKHKFGIGLCVEKFDW